MRKLLILFVILLTWCGSFAQSKKTLERKKQETLKEISYTNKLLRETQINKKASFNQLLLIEKKIRLREELLNNIKQEQSQLKNEIAQNNKNIELLEADLRKIKEEYAQMLRFAYEHRNQNDIILFIFSAESFNQAYKRLKYIQQYSDYRKKQALVIVQTQDTLNTRIVKLEQQKLSLDSLIQEHIQESIALKVEKSSQNQVVLSLRSEEQKLKQKLEKYQREKIQIQNAIAELIRKEAEKAKAKNKINSYDALTPEQKLISTKFGENQGRLPWPVQRGIVTYKFGIQPHPVLKDIKEKKNGIGISTTKGSLARSIFDGIVTNILPLSGNNNAVMVKHGEYITVYVNIKEVMVTVGQTIKAKEELGSIYTNPDDQRTTLELQVWKGTTLLNPALWISKQ
jgi:septal ring factor EnvC (AmiA/AmiB activator)